MKYKVFRIGFGYVESQSHTTISFTHTEGFDSPEEGLKNLVNTWLDTIKQFRISSNSEFCAVCEYTFPDKDNWNHCPRCGGRIKKQETPQSKLLEFVREFFTSTNDSQEQEEWEFMDQCGWNIGEDPQDKTFLLTSVECFDSCLGLDWGYPSYIAYEVTQHAVKEHTKLNPKDFV